MRLYASWLARDILKPLCWLDLCSSVLLSALFVCCVLRAIRVISCATRTKRGLSFALLAPRSYSTPPISVQEPSVSSARHHARGPTFSPAILLCPCSPAYQWLFSLDLISAELLQDISLFPLSALATPFAAFSSHPTPAVLLFRAFISSCTQDRRPHSDQHSTNWQYKAPGCNIDTTNLARVILIAIKPMTDIVVAFCWSPIERNIEYIEAIDRQFALQLNSPSPAKGRSSWSAVIVLNIVSQQVPELLSTSIHEKCLSQAILDWEKASRLCDTCLNCPLS